MFLLAWHGTVGAAVIIHDSTKLMKLGRKGRKSLYHSIHREASRAAEQNSVEVIDPS